MGCHRTELTIADYHARLRAGTTSVEVTIEGYLDRIERVDPELNAIITINDRSRAIARARDEQGFDGRPLFGVPILLKDQAMTTGLRTTFGSKAFREFVPDRNATLVDALEDAGGIIVAKTNLPDFAAGFVGYSSAGGQTKNPYDPERDPGGSSAGTAAGIAANLGLVGIGEDTGGSIRVPAAFCNLYGHRPTTGLISRDGWSPLVVNQDTPGPICRTVEDLARVLDVLVGFDPKDEATAVHASWEGSEGFIDRLGTVSLAETRIGVLRDGFGSGERADPVTEAVDDTLATMKRAGATLVDPIDIPEYKALLAESSLYKYVAKRDLNSFLDTLTDGPIDDIDDIFERGMYHEDLELLETIRAAPTDPSDDRAYWKRLERQRDLRRRIRFTLLDHDLDAIAFPNAQVVPPRYEQYYTGEINRSNMPMNTLIASQSGCPGISVPAGFTGGGLPVGLELMGAPFSDRHLVALAGACDHVVSARHPPDF